MAPKRWTSIDWIIFLIILPLILSITIIFDPTEKISLSRENGTLKISEDDVFKPSLKNMIRDIIQVPFDFKWYNICFNNNKTKLIYSSGENEDLDLIVVFDDFKNKTRLPIPYGKTNCKNYKFNKDFIYSWEFNSPSDAHVSWNVESYVLPEWHTIIAKNILFLIAWNVLGILILEIKKLIKKGIDKI